MSTSRTRRRVPAKRPKIYAVKLALPAGFGEIPFAVWAVRPDQIETPRWKRARESKTAHVVTRKRLANQFRQWRANGGKRVPGLPPFAPMAADWVASFVQQQAEGGDA
jgi:hypothetical protein